MRFTLPSRDPQELQPVLDALRRHGALIVHVERTRETLEELFVRSVSDEQGKYIPGARLPGSGSQGGRA